MENMDKGLTVPKWMLLNWPKVWNFDEKRLHWASVVRVANQRNITKLETD
jgi:hypothetical protein